HRFPAQLDDVRRGLRYVRAHAAELGIDPERVALLGLSAGAHLAMLAHLARDVPALAPVLDDPTLDRVSEDVRAVIAHYGPYDLSRRAVLPPELDMIGALLGARGGDPRWVPLAATLHRVERARPA